ncbi:hypothetical protein BOX15_Mlig023092g2, partial [Macrostomum lignano]
IAHQIILMTGPASTSSTGTAASVADNAKTGTVVAINSANCSLNDSVTDAESIVMKLQQYRSDIVRQVGDICTQRAQLLEQQRRQCRECVDRERSQLPGRQLALNYADYVRSVQLPSLIQQGVTLPGGIQLDGVGAGGGDARGATAGAARGKTATARGGRTARGRQAGAAAAAALAAAAASSTRGRPAKLQIVNPFKFSPEDLERIDPREVQKLRELFDKLACLFGSDSGVGSR